MYAIASLGVMLLAGANLIDPQAEIFGLSPKGAAYCAGINLLLILHFFGRTLWRMSGIDATRAARREKRDFDF